MKRRAARYMGWLRRRLWGLWPGRNPLRRRCDRAEAVILAGLMAAFVIGSPLAALAAGRWAHDSAARAAHAEMSSWHQVRAVLLTTAFVRQAWAPAMARARWTASGGARRTGWVPAPAGAAAGTTVRVWVDAAGRPRDAPLQRTQMDHRAVQAATLAVLALAVVLGEAGLFARYLFDRRRLAAWDAEWRATGPKWSHHG
jgi:hypothetical protein